jgi:hypothetical protein
MHALFGHARGKGLRSVKVRAGSAKLDATQGHRRRGFPECRMPSSSFLPGMRRRRLLLAAAAWPLPSRAAPVLTPRELSGLYRSHVDRSLAVPRNEALIYGGLAEMTLGTSREPISAEPQYLLVVDSCPSMQVAFLFWRLLQGHYELVGASPASTGDPEQAGCVATPCGVFPQRHAAGVRASRVYDFGLQRVRVPQRRDLVPVHLQARAAQGRSRARLGTPQSDGRVLLPASLVAFLDAYGVLDASLGTRAPNGEEVPFAGRYLVVLDSERADRPDWAAA